MKFCLGRIGLLIRSLVLLVAMQRNFCSYFYSNKNKKPHRQSKGPLLPLRCIRQKQRLVGRCHLLFISFKMQMHKGHKGKRGTFALALLPLCPVALLPDAKKQPLLLAMLATFARSAKAREATGEPLLVALLPFCPFARCAKARAMRKSNLCFWLCNATFARTAKAREATGDPCLGAAICFSFHFRCKCTRGTRATGAMRKSKACNFCLGRIGLLTCSPGYCWLCNATFARSAKAREAKGVPCLGGAPLLWR